MYIYGLVVVYFNHYMLSVSALSQKNLGNYICSANNSLDVVIYSLYSSEPDPSEPAIKWSIFLFAWIYAINLKN